MLKPVLVSVCLKGLGGAGGGGAGVALSITFHELNQ